MSALRGVLERAVEDYFAEPMPRTRSHLIDALEVAVRDGWLSDFPNGDETEAAAIALFNPRPGREWGDAVEVLHKGFRKDARAALLAAMAERLSS